MNTNGLRKLAGHLRDYGLSIDENDAEHRMQVTNPLHGAEEIIAHRGRYVTSHGYEVGERGEEKGCATRIAQILAVSVRPGLGGGAAGGAPAGPVDPAPASAAVPLRGLETVR